jgi:hypothetical protein
MRGLTAAGLLDIENERFFSYNLFSKLPYSAVVEARNTGPIKARTLIYELIKIFEDPDSVTYGNLASFGAAPKYPDFLIPWNAFSGKSRNLLHKAMNLAGVKGVDFKTGFTYTHLTQVGVDTLNEIDYAGEKAIAQLKDEIKQVLAGLQSNSEIYETPESDIQIAHPANSEKLSISPDLSNCQTIEDLYQLLLAQVELMPVMQHFPFHEADERKLHVLKARHPAFCSQTQTLDSIGSIWGVTRERIRQIELQLLPLKLAIDAPIPLLDQLVALMAQAGSEDEFKEAAFNAGLIRDQSTHLSAHRLLAIAEFLNRSDLLTGLNKFVANWEVKENDYRELESKVKNYRSQFGLIDLQLFSTDSSLTREESIKLINKVYPRSIFSGNLALARTANFDSMFEGSIAKQLHVASPLSSEELIAGLQRTSKNRKVPLIGALEEIGGIIRELAGEPNSYDHLLVNILEPIELEQIDTFLVETFRNAQLGIMHRNEVVEVGLSKGIHPTSIGIYLSSSPIVRSFGRAIFGLVGTTVDPEIVQTYLEVYREVSESAEVELQVINAFEVLLKVKPNINTLTSGTIFLSGDEKPLFLDKKFQAGCSCGNFETKQIVKVTNSGFWNGFATMFQHGIADHDYSKDSQFVYRFDFESGQVTLIT